MSMTDEEIMNAVFAGDVERLRGEIDRLSRQLAEARAQIEKLTRMLTGSGGLEHSRYRDGDYGTQEVLRLWKEDSDQN